MELKPETLAEIEEAIPKYPEKQSAVMPLLHAIQKDRGLLTNEVPEWVAGKLGMEPIQVLSVITFYRSSASIGLESGTSAFAEPFLTLPMAGGAKVCDKMLSEFDTDLNEISPDDEVTVEFAGVWRAAGQLLLC